MGTKAIWLLLIGGCSVTSPTLDRVDQEVADPAPILTISDARFHSWPDGSNVQTCGQVGATLVGPCTSLPPTQVRWGNSVVTDRSGLGFAMAGAHTIVYEAAFDIGTLTHFNYPTAAGTASTAVSLDLHLRVDPSNPGPALFDQAITIPLAIHETPNQEGFCPYPSTFGNPCSDKITFLTSTFQLASTQSSTVYELEIVGFIDTFISPDPLDGLISQEGGSSSAALRAVVREHCVDADEDGDCDCANDDGTCIVEDLCPCDGPWKNHGQYVSCVAHEGNRLVSEGLLTHQVRADLVSAAGQSSCGK